MVVGRDVGITSPNFPHWAHDRIAVCVVIDAHTSLSILLIRELEGAAVYLCDFLCYCLPIHLPESALLVSFEKGGVFESEAPSVSHHCVSICMHILPLTGGSIKQ